MILIPHFRKYYKQFVVSFFIEKGILFLTLQMSVVLIVLLFALAVSGQILRTFLQIFFFASSAGLILFFVLKFKKEISWRNICLHLENKTNIFRDILNAIELAQFSVKEGISRDLRDAVIAQVSVHLEKENPKDWIRPEKLKRYSLIFATVLGIYFGLFLLPTEPLLSGWNRLTVGDEKELARYLKVMPAGRKVISGESVPVIVELLAVDHPIPKLFTQGPAGWDEADGQTLGRKTSFILNSVIKPLRYKVRWKGLESAVYALIPVDPPRLTDFSVRLIYPSYTGLAEQFLKQEPQLEVFRGTKIEIEALSLKVLKEIQMVSSDGAQYPVQLIKGKKIKVQFLAQNPMVLHFEMEDAEGIRPHEPASYNIQIRDDTAPSIRILAPSSDLIVGKESRIPFTFELKDDMGITGLFLKVQRGDQSMQKISLKRFQPPVIEKIDSAEFSVSSLRPYSGEILKLQLEAQDNDLVTGPKYGFSEILLVEIRSYEKEHAEIQKDIKEFQKELLNLLAEQTNARLPNEKEAWEQKSAESLKKQSQSIAKSEQLEKQLNKILERMERDPLTDFSVWNEHKGIHESLKTLRAGAMNEAEKFIQEKKFEEALNAQDFAISEMERLAAVSEESHKYAKMKDLMHQADRLTEKGENLENKLSGSDSLNSELYKLLQETLQETMDILNEIQKQIQDLPQELPEEFVNQPALKEVNLDKIGQSAENLQEALRRGDIKAALQAAKSLLSQAKAAREQIAKAAEDVTSTSTSDFAKENQENLKQLQQITEQQEKLLEKTSSLESQRKQSYLEKQKTMLTELASRQKKVIAESQQTLIQLRVFSLPQSAELRQILEPVLPKMQSVLIELEKQNVIFSQKWLAEIVQMLDPGNSVLERLTALQISTPSVPAGSEDLQRLVQTNKKVIEVRNEEQFILEQLKNPPAMNEHTFSEQNLKELQELSNMQSQLAEDSKKLRGQMSKLASKSAMVSLEMLESLRSAQGEMRSASNSLKETKAETAQTQQQKALSYLRNAKEGMQGIEQQLSQSKQGSGQRKTSIIQPRNLPGGQVGFRTGIVRIPGAEEYLPPREFREEFLESLKEKYPKTQENLIKDYYKKLSQ